MSKIKTLIPVHDVNTLGGVVSLRTRMVITAKTKKRKIVASVDRCADFDVKQMTATIVVKSEEDIAVAEMQARARLTNKINTYYADTLPALDTLAAIYDAKLSVDGSHAEWYSLCPVTWRSDATRSQRLKYFRKHFLGPVSMAWAENAFGTSTEDSIRAEILETVGKNIERRSGSAGEKSDDRVKGQANKHIEDCNLLYEAFRAAHPEGNRFPDVRLQLFDLGRNIRPEQCKALEWEVLITLAALFRLDIPVTPLSLGGVLMMCGLLRTAEATAPKYGDLLIFDDYAIYGVIWQSDGTTRIADLKTDNSYRLVVLPKFAVDCILARKQYLLDAGWSGEEINRSYVVSARDDIFAPASPHQLSAYVKSLLSEIGCDEYFWAAAAELMATEPDFLPDGSKLMDLACYVLRRSGCTYLCNCAGIDPRIVDVMMGHVLREQDRAILKTVKIEDQWAIIADHLECVVLDPAHSAHPAYAPRKMMDAANDSGQKVAHSKFCFNVTPEIASAGEITIVIETLKCDEIEIGLPTHASMGRIERTPVTQKKAYPALTERLDEQGFAVCIAAAKKIHAKVGRVT